MGLLLVELIFLVRVTTDLHPSLQARIYPEKATYFLGEPIFLDLELVNVTEKPVAVDSRLGEPCATPDTIEVVGAKRRLPGHLPVMEGLPAAAVRVGFTWGQARSG